MKLGAQVTTWVSMTQFIPAGRTREDAALEMTLRTFAGIGLQAALPEICLYQMGEVRVGGQSPLDLSHVRPIARGMGAQHLGGSAEAVLDHVPDDDRSRCSGSDLALTIAAYCRTDAVNGHDQTHAITDRDSDAAYSGDFALRRRAVWLPRTSRMSRRVSRRIFGSAATKAMRKAKKYAQGSKFSIGGICNTTRRRDRVAVCFRSLPQLGRKNRSLCL